MMTMTTYIILAGGKSSRMGQDKALMLRGTNRIYQLCKEIGASRIITLCGDKSRIDLFEGEVWPDPVDVFGVLDTIKWCLNNIDGETQIIPCDAFNLEKEGISDNTFDTIEKYLTLNRLTPLGILLSSRHGSINVLCDFNFNRVPIISIKTFVSSISDLLGRSIGICDE